MFRRQQFDKVNPRNVLPSRHTIFIRGLPGSTDVGKVKEYFSSETNSKCSIDFFSTSEDRKRLSVAIRFKSNDLAREMLNKYNNNILFGHPVELTWFKDLKKARAKMFEEQRQGGGRSFQRSGYRGNFRNYPDRRGMAGSPSNYDGRRGRTGSSSSGGAAENSGFRGNTGKPRYSQSRSRSFTGSSSRSASPSGQSRSRSHSRGRQLGGSATENRGNARAFSDGQRITGRQPRKQPARSVSGSSSSSRSSNAHLRANSGSRAISGQKMPYDRVRGAASPLNYAKPHGSDFPAFSNTPAPDPDGGSSLVSGLIQLNRRAQMEPERRLPGRSRRSSLGSSSSGISGGSPRGKLNNSNASLPRGTLGKRLRSLSPPFSGTHQRERKIQSGESSPDQAPLSDDHRITKRRRAKRDVQSPRSPPIRRVPIDASAAPDLSDRHCGSSFDHSVSNKASRSNVDHVRRSEFGNSTRTGQLEGNSFEDNRSDHVYNRRTNRQRSSPNSRWRSPEGSITRDGANTESDSTYRDARRSTKHRDLSVEASSASDVPNARLRVDAESTRSTKIKSHLPHSEDDGSPQGETRDIPVDPIDLIRQRKEALAQDYKRDCEAFTTVVRTLISLSFPLATREGACFSLLGG